MTRSRHEADRPTADTSPVRTKVPGSPRYATPASRHRHMVDTPRCITYGVLLVADIPLLTWGDSASRVPVGPPLRTEAEVLLPW
jgi:hypothetical protein